MRKVTIALGLVTVALASIGQACADAARSIQRLIDTGIRWLFTASPYAKPALALGGQSGSLDPQPGNQPISLALYNHNRHEAHSHARAASRAI